jgi:hypothetical protein
MAILAQCPICRAKRKVSNKLCNCGVDSDKAKRVIALPHYAANVDRIFFVAYVRLKKQLEG